VPKWVLWIARRSYAIYLSHPEVICALGKVAPGDTEVVGAATFVVALGISCLIADLLRRAIEKPMVLRGRSLAARSS
jgi:peptidoglycan/LPS O-acetylase OafA/YrhL